MVRDRWYGSDVAVMAWCREKARTGELPAFSEQCGMVQNDVDAFWHRYKTCIDNLGTRELQVFMEIEWKTRSGMLTDSQADTYRKKHAMMMPHLRWNNQQLVNFGVTIVSISGTTPDNSEVIKWGRFAKNEETAINWTKITVDELLKLMRFDMHPDTFNDDLFRRHHKTRKYKMIEKCELGFEVEREFVHRS